MRLNREIDALEVHGVDVLGYLAAPRLFGVALANLCLTLFLVLSAYAGCVLLAPFVSLTSIEIFVRDLGGAIFPRDVARLAVKGLLFGLAIPIVTVYHGLTLKQDLNEIPRAATRAVVGAMVFVFTIDALLALVGNA
jgi:phospholipid/cholesterol/gamma-HCH transport system permease protein